MYFLLNTRESCYESHVTCPWKQFCKQYEFAVTQLLCKHNKSITIAPTIHEALKVKYLSRER